jgi:hypothetical protein
VNLQTITAPKWHRIDDSLGSVVSGSVLFWLLFCCITADITDSWYAGIVVVIPLIIILILVYRWFRHRSTWEYKLFFVPFVEATQIVANVLRSKGLPYHQVDSLSSGKPRVVFDLEDSNLVIKVSGVQDGNQRIARVEMRPTTRDSRPLVHSLQEKIDDAFLPQGFPR